METCRAFYSIGVPFLLRQQVWLRDLAAVESFHDFLFAVSPAPSNRPKLLRDLRITSDLEEKESSIMLRVLSSAVHLHSLYLKLSKANVREFRNVLSGLADLRKLELFLKKGVHASTALRWLKRTQSHIHTLKLHFPFMSHPQQVISAIYPLAGTLKTLTFTNAIIKPMDGLEFPSVRSLTIIPSATHLLPLAATVFSLFPNLEELTSHGNQHQFLTEIDLDQMHVSTVQDALDNGVHRRCLKTVQGSLRDLYWGGYVCSVESLTLVIDDFDEWDYDRASSLLSHNRPSKFSLFFQLQAVWIQTTQIIQAFKDLPSLGSFMELSVCISVMFPDDGIKEIFVSASGQLIAIPLS